MFPCEVEIRSERLELRAGVEEGSEGSSLEHGSLGFTI